MLHLQVLAMAGNAVQRPDVIAGNIQVAGYNNHNNHSSSSNMTSVRMAAGHKRDMATTANIRKVGVALDAIEVLQVIVGKVEVGDGGKRSIRAQAANVVADGLDPPGLGWVVVVSHLREAWHGDEHEANSARQGKATHLRSGMLPSPARPLRSFSSKLTASSSGMQLEMPHSEVRLLCDTSRERQLL